MVKRMPALLLALIASACTGSGDGDPTTTTGVTDATVAAADTTTTADAAAATTTTTRPTGTTAAPTTTLPATTTTIPATTTTSAAITTTSAPPTTVAPSVAPQVSITTPDSVQRYEATFDAGAGNFGAVVQFAASVSDPDGDAVTVEWYSDLHGFLGTGTSLAVRLSVDGDTSQPIITAVATDATGATASASQQIIVWILSDT